MFEGGWFRSGDVGKCNRDGLYWVTDRIKEMIKVSCLERAEPSLFCTDFSPGQWLPSQPCGTRGGPAFASSSFGRRRQARYRRENRTAGCFHLSSPGGPDRGVQGRAEAFCSKRRVPLFVLENARRHPR